MGQDKSHKNSVEYHKNLLENEKFGFTCRKEFPVPVNGKIHQIDLGCFRTDLKNEGKNPVIIKNIGLETESHKSFNSKTAPNTPAIISNHTDLEIFKHLYGEDTTKTFHINTNEVIDFDKELSKPQPNIKPQNKTRTIVRRYGQ